MSHPDTKKQDNAAETFLASPKRWYDAGFIGILFGSGNSDCANYLNDNGWFVTNVKAYNQNPWEFPATATKYRMLIQQNNSINITKSASGILIKGIYGAREIEICTLPGRIVARSNNPHGEIVIGESVKIGIYILSIKNANGASAARFIYNR
jgi:hypothetical protein